VSSQHPEADEAGDDEDAENDTADEGKTSIPSAAIGDGSPATAAIGVHTSRASPSSITDEPEP
jgi:hypothetical protein